MRYETCCMVRKTGYIGTTKRTFSEESGEVLCYLGRHGPWTWNVPTRRAEAAGTVAACRTVAARARVNQRWSAISLIFSYNAGSGGVQGATVLSLCPPVPGKDAGKRENSDRSKETGDEVPGNGEGGTRCDQRKRDGKIIAECRRKKGMTQQELGTGCM